MPRCDVDQLAETLANWGRLARSLPPSWRGAGLSHPIVGPEGQLIGRCLPGKGIYIDCDLKYAGIARDIPHVYERTPMRILQELACDERGAITSMANVQAAIQAGQSQVATHVRTNVACNVGQLLDLWSTSKDAQRGINQVYSTFPGGTTYDRTLTGSLNEQMIDPIGTNTTYLISFGINVGLNGGGHPNGFNWYVISDFLVAAGLIPIDVNSTTTVNTTALPRYTNGVGVFGTFVGTGAGGTASGVFCTASYTNQAGTAGQTIIFPTTANSGQGEVTHGDPVTFTPMPFFSLAPGDYGVQSVQSFSINAAQSAGRKVAVHLQYPLCFVPGTSAADDYFEYDLTSNIMGLIPLSASSNGHLCALSVMGMPPGSVGGSQFITMTFKTVQG